MNDDALQHAAELIRQADGLLVTAGAGMGVDSGLPDFRGREGFWQAYPALAQARLDSTTVASPATFERDPQLAWGFYGHRLALYRRTRPHAGFALLQAWGRRLRHGAAVFTSNVDGQFQRAGFEPALVHECHGSLHWLQCLRGCGEPPMPADGLTPDVDEAECRWRGSLPTCPGCGGLLRPNLLMFGDWGWIGDRYDAQELRLSRWLGSVRRPVVVEIGAGTALPAVRHFGHQVVQQCGGQLVRINPREHAVAPGAGVGLAGEALALLSALDARLAALDG